MLIRPYNGVEPRVGERVFIAENATIIGDVEVGDDASIWYGTVVRGDVFPIRIGKRSNIQDNCVVHVTNGTHATHIGDEVTIGHGVIVHGCTIENNCLIGMGSRILDGAVVGAGSLVGAGALVTQNTKIPPRSLVLGFPAKVVRQLSDAEYEQIQTNQRNYLEYKETYLRESSAS